MSIKAYRVNFLDEKLNFLDKEKKSSFDLWLDEKVVDYFNIPSNIINNGGMIKLSVEELEILLEEHRLPDDTRDMLTADLEYAKSYGDKVLWYVCY